MTLDRRTAIFPQRLLLGDTLREKVGSYLAALSPGELATTLVAGLSRAELGKLVSMHSDVVRDGAALDRFIGDAPVITDDFAPIDQWLAEDRRAG